MSFTAPTGHASAGRFTHAETNVTFYYEPALDDERRSLFNVDNDFNERIVFDHGHGTRLAKIIKTRAYIIIDEDTNGNPMIETWPIKRHVVYADQSKQVETRTYR